MSEQEKDFLEGMTEQVEVVEAETPVAATPEPATVDTPATPAPVVTTTPEPRKDETVPVAALMAEREKRQRYERELEELRKQKEQEALPSFYEAPEQHLTHVMQRAQQEATQRLYAALEESARESYADYDEVFGEVQAHCAENPAATHQIMSAANPALAAYKFGKQLREMKAMQDPATYREKLRAEILAELQKEQSAKEEAKRAAADAIPPDLASTRSASAGADVVPDPFNELFKE